jgi:hypothetical protein
MDIVIPTNRGQPSRSNISNLKLFSQIFVVASLAFGAIFFIPGPDIKLIQRQILMTSCADFRSNTRRSVL